MRLERSLNRIPSLRLSLSRSRSFTLSLAGSHRASRSHTQSLEAWESWEMKRNKMDDPSIHFAALHQSSNASAAGVVDVCPFLILLQSAAAFCVQPSRRVTPYT